MIQAPRRAFELLHARKRRLRCARREFALAPGVRNAAPRSCSRGRLTFCARSSTALTGECLSPNLERKRGPAFEVPRRACVSATGRERPAGAQNRCKTARLRKRQNWVSGLERNSFSEVFKGLSASLSRLAMLASAASRSHQCICATGYPVGSPIGISAASGLHQFPVESAPPQSTAT